MRLAIVLALLIALATLVALPASAQYTELWLSTEPDGWWDCNLFDTAPQLQTVYVLLGQYSETLGVRFRVEQSVGCTLLYLQDLPEGLYVEGDVVNGLTVCFGECVGGSPPQLLATIHYFGMGTSSPCSTIEIKPVDPSPSIEAIACDGTVHAAYGWTLFVNDTGFQCPCFVASQPSAKPELAPLTDDDNFCGPVATEPFTWGAIKALYK